MSTVVISSDEEGDLPRTGSKLVNFLRKSIRKQHVPIKKSKPSKTRSAITSIELNDNGDDEEYQLDVHTKSKTQLELQKLLVPKPKPCPPTTIPNITTPSQTSPSVEQSLFPKPISNSLTITPIITKPEALNPNNETDIPYLKVKNIDTMKDKSTLEINQSTNLFILDPKQSKNVLKYGLPKTNVSVIRSNNGSPSFEISNIQSLSSAGEVTIAPIRKKSKRKRAVSEVISIEDDEPPAAKASKSVESEIVDETVIETDDVIWIETDVDKIDLSSDSESESTEKNTKNRSNTENQEEVIGNSGIENIQISLPKDTTIEKMNDLENNLSPQNDQEISIKKTPDSQTHSEKPPEIENIEISKEEEILAPPPIVDLDSDDEGKQDPLVDDNPNFSKNETENELNKVDSELIEKDSENFNLNPSQVYDPPEVAPPIVDLESDDEGKQDPSVDDNPDFSKKEMENELNKIESELIEKDSEWSVDSPEVEIANGMIDLDSEDEKSKDKPIETINEKEIDTSDMINLDSDEEVEVEKNIIEKKQSEEETIIKPIEEKESTIDLDSEEEVTEKVVLEKKDCEEPKPVDEEKPPSPKEKTEEIDEFDYESGMIDLYNDEETEILKTDKESKEKFQNFNRSCVVLLNKDDNLEEMIQNSQILNEEPPRSPKSDEENIVVTCEDLFDTFIEKCQLDTIPSDSKEIIIEKLPNIRRRFAKLDPDYRDSDELITLLKSKIVEVESKPKLAIVAFDVVLTEFRSNKRQQEEGDKVDKEKQMKIKKLEMLLKLLRRKISELETREMDSKEDWDEDSIYIQADRYHRKSVSVYAKLCELCNEDPKEGRPVFSKINFQASRHPEINSAITKLYNKKREFPDYRTVNKCIRKCVKKHKLKLTNSYIDDEAREMFKLLGKMLQKKRFKDFKESLTCYPREGDLFEFIDPANNDPSLEAELKENSKQGLKKIADVMESFTNKQIAGEDNVVSDCSVKTCDSSSDNEGG